MTQTAYAEHRGCSVSRINQLVGSGRIELDDAGRIPVEATDAILDETLDVTKKARAEKGQASEYWQNRARRERLEADRSELALLEKSGKLIDAEKAKRAQYALAQRLVSDLMQLPARISPIIAPQDPQRAEQVLLDEFRAALADIAKVLEAAEDDNA